ncbi:carbon-nitrogen hydrolase family protein [Parasphingopyxis sp.]|uniref:carbon-nitrogen hydrolase family protein n=1 Tax=Parasphingopyxis sp. TaxID=1920299 RepID=UPI00262EA6A9|nr:carbon-nitrogen hydrolase family protein [Parasphingopyxis sp.]
MTGTMCQVALVQLRTPYRIIAARDHALPLVEKAMATGADLIILPETCNMMARDSFMLRASACAEVDDLFVASMRERAAHHARWILLGSVVVRTTDGRCANRSLLIDPTGGISARYDKIHLFDVHLDNGEMHRESDIYVPGSIATVADTPWGGLGLSICYDIRFPELYRDLAMAGAVMHAVPAAFTAQTGKAHWETLLRARAIETGSYILAAAQGGEHAGGAVTWGRSMIVSPWGHVVAMAVDDSPDVVIATLDLSAVDHAREKIAALAHRRAYTVPKSPEKDRVHG